MPISRTSDPPLGQGIHQKIKAEAGDKCTAPQPPEKQEQIDGNEEHPGKRKATTKIAIDFRSTSDHIPSPTAEKEEAEYEDTGYGTRQHRLSLKNLWWEEIFLSAK